MKAGFVVLLAAAALLGNRHAAAQSLYSIGAPTNNQQYMLELINRARANGGAEAARLGLSSLQEGSNINGQAWMIENSVQPLSWNSLLTNAAQGQANRLNNADQFFLGGSPHTFGGTTPTQRISATGYSIAPYNGPTTPSGYYPGNENVSEEVSQGSGGFVGPRLTAAVVRAHNGLFTDQDTAGRGHRQTMMLGFFREVGIGISSGTDNQANPGQPNGPWDSLYIVQDYSTQSNQKPFITGVVFRDANGNHFYDPGEGIGGVRVDVQPATFYAVTAASGGYSVPVAGNGSYNVTFSGGEIATSHKTATISGNRNVKVDYLVGLSATILDGTGDFNGDGSPDLVLRNSGNGRTTIWYLHGNAFFSSANGPTLPVGWMIAYVADLNHDSKPDFVLFNPSTHQTAIWFLNNTAYVSSAYGPTLPQGWTLIAAVDVNGDSKLDYVLFNATTRRTAFWFLNGTARAGGTYGPTLPAGWVPASATDFNGDTKPDFLLSNSATRRTAVWYLNGQVRIGSAYGPTLPPGWTLRAADDFNNDNKPDYLLFKASTRRTAIWYLNGTTFTASTYGPTLPAN
jgi:hypothetical protein